MNAKIEIYKFKLLNEKKTQNACFHNFLTANVAAEESEVFLDLFQKFRNKLDKEEFHLKGKKGFTGFDLHKTEHSNPSILPDSKGNIIYGKLDGGQHGRKRGLSNVKRKSEKSEVSETKIITDTFYFLLYTPLDSNQGILFIQSIGSDNITKPLIDFIEKFFTKLETSYTKPKFERFIPNSIKEEFKQDSALKKMIFTETFIDKGYSTKGNFEKQNVYTIKIEVTSKENENKQVSDVINRIFSLGSILNNGRTLSEFGDKKVVIKNKRTGRNSNAFKLSNTFEIKPAIYLNDYEGLIVENEINFDALHKFCLNMLEKVKNEIYSINKVSEIR